MRLRYKNNRVTSHGKFIGNNLSNFINSAYNYMTYVIAIYIIFQKFDTPKLRYSASKGGVSCVNQRA